MTERRLYIFNPDNDLALANGHVNYMPPASARQMMEDLALLPAWYASPGSGVLASSAYNLAFLREMQKCISLPVALVTEPEVASEPDIQPVPWGWNPALRRKLQVLGVAEQGLPSLLRLEELRELSHRRQAVELLPRLLLINEYFCGESCYMTDREEWRHFVEGQKACLLKAPLSGSGKGLNWCKGVFTTFISGWCNRVAALQGGVVGEPVYDKVADFAMEFFSDGEGGVVFAGYSVFSTNGSGAYDGNLLLPDEEMERRLSEFVPKEAFRELRLVLEKELSLKFGTVYSGYLGVDMMICRFPSAKMEYRIHPCVEINLRMNMGMVARVIYDRYVASGSTGCFRIAYHPVAGEALQAHGQRMAGFPLEIRNGKVVSGYLPLVPVSSQSMYCAFVICRE